ncbi:MAG: cytochrome d ubiquinol oxidase subunit II [Candidatus Sumerlaeia bacterium]|nr:cytochrome d ubiquinol oxidase subunit II [Candidatus Sumerlaeia bacterium]
MIDLNITWFLLLGFLLIGYAILDGFDLGVGTLHLFSKGDEERRLMMNSIGPVWDGNEVWLVTAGGALFAAFPHAYATAFSGFYLPFMFLLFALIFRAVALEFRSKEKMAWWRQLWDVSFCISSAVAAILFGVAVGNLVVGLPIDNQFEYTGGFFNLLSPYAVTVGLFSLALLTMHGAIYVYLKTEGALQERSRGWIYRSYFIFLAMYTVVTVWTLMAHRHMIENFTTIWWVWIIVLLKVLAIANIPRALHLRLPFRAFISSCCVIAAIIFVFGVGMFPYLIVSSTDPLHSLTVYNAASSSKTHGIMFIIALLGMPCVIAYTASIYYVFRGKTKLDSYSY